MSKYLAEPKLELEVLTRLDKARTRIRKDLPYLMSSVRVPRILVLDVPEDRLSMAITRHGVLLVGSEFVTVTLDTIDRVAYVYAHEALHLACNHHNRVARLLQTRSVPRHIIAYAIDLPANSILDGTTLQRPTEGIFPDQLGVPAGLTFEQYVDILLTMQLEPPRIPRAANGECGSGSGLEHPLEQEIEQHLAAQIQEIQMSPQELRSAVKAAADVVRTAIRAGNAKGSAEELQEDPVEPSKIPWEARLSSVFSHAIGMEQDGATRRTLRRFHRQSLVINQFRGKWVTSLPTIGFIEDTSGSMNKENTKNVRAQFIKIMKEMGLDTVLYLQGDAEAQGEVATVGITDLAKLKIRGRGGTSFVEPIQRMIRAGAELIVYGTDGDGAYGPPAAVPVIWALTDPYDPPWGVSVRCWDEYGR